MGTFGDQCRSIRVGLVEIFGDPERIRDGQSSFGIVDDRKGIIPASVLSLDRSLDFVLLVY